MIEIRQTEVYSKWFDGLRDHAAQVRINVRIRRLSLGNPGDVKSIGKGVSGDKRTQEKDIQRALELAQNL